MGKRMTDLLLKAADCFQGGCSPFHTEWLCENKVTADECITLSNLIGVLVKGACHSPRVYQNAILLCGALEDKDAARMGEAAYEAAIRVSMGERLDDLIIRMKNAG